MNHLLSGEEWAALPAGLLDQGVTDGDRSVCGPALLHCMHNSEQFSKHAFNLGQYTNLSLAGLDLTNTRYTITDIFQNNDLMLSCTGQGLRDLPGHHVQQTRAARPRGAAAVAQGGTPRYRYCGIYWSTLPGLVSIL